MLPHLVPHFRLLTLGAPLLVSATDEAVRYRTRKHFALLIRLALEPGRKFARDYLIDLLWPDVPSERGRHSLSQAITMLRHSLGRASLTAHRATVALNEGVVAVDALQLESAEVVVRGRFLDGFELRGARGFDEWREAWAARLYPQIRDCLVRQMDAGRRVGDFETVERHARVLEELDPLSEDAVRGIMEARAWVGDRSNALKAFTRYAGRLSEELSAKASPELTRIADLLREGRRAAPRPTPDGVPPREERRYESETIIGREREFSALYDAWLDVRNNRPRLMVVLGDPGIGKTTLTNAFVSSCQMEGGIIARSQAYDAERELPYAVLAELVRQLSLQRSIGAAEPEALAELTRLCPDIFTIFPGVPRPAEWPPEVVPLRLADAFTKAVTASADDLPVVLVVDDIHAADNASIAILHMLARKLTGLRVLMILTGRSATLRRPSSAHALVTDGVIEGLGTVELDALPAEPAAVLVARASAQGVDRWGEPPIERIVRAGGGNPLALELLSREWVEAGPNSLTSQLDAGRSLPPSLVSIPKAIRTMVDWQTEQLEERTRAVLELASMLGRRMGDLWLYEVIGCSEAEALHQLTQLLGVHLLRDIAGKLEFRNELVRAHCYYEIPSAIRIELHKRIARVLEVRNDLGDQRDLEIAWHHILGRDLKRGVAFALPGAERSLKAGAPREAELVLRSLIHQEIGIGDGRRIQVLLGSALMSQSKAEEALPHLQQLLLDASANRIQAAEAARLYASAMYLLNRNSAAKQSEMAAQAVTVARECQDPDLLGHALLESARAGLECGVELMIERARDELREIITAPAVKPPGIAYHAYAFCNYHLLDVSEAGESAQKAVTGLASEGKIVELALAYTGLGNCMTAMCRHEEALAAFHCALDLSMKIGDDSRVSIVCSNISASHLLSGDMDAAIRFGERSLQVASRAPSQPVLPKALSNLAFSHLVVGNTSRARACYQSLREWIREGRSWAITVTYCYDSAALELAFGNQEEALSLIAEADRVSAGRAKCLVSPGTTDRLDVFSAYRKEGVESARRLVVEACNRFENRHPSAFLDAIAGLAWLERTYEGRCSESTVRKLQMFEELGCTGKRSVLAAQGFLVR